MGIGFIDLEKEEYKLINETHLQKGIGGILSFGILR